MYKKGRPPGGLRCTSDTGVDCRSATGVTYCCHQFLNWWLRYDAGIPHLILFDSFHIPLHEKDRPVGGFRCTSDTGVDCRSAAGVTYCCHQFLNWWLRHAAGIPHLILFDSFRIPLHEKDRPVGGLFHGAGYGSRTRLHGLGNIKACFTLYSPNRKKCSICNGFSVFSKR